MKKDLISIIVPIYCVEKYLDKSISSLINQTYTNLEIILIDDESKDRSPEICDKYAKKDNRIKVIHQKHQGVSTARNNGLKLATGKYLSFMDPDDTVEPDFIEILYENMNKAPLVICNHYVHNQEKTNEKCCLEDQFICKKDMYKMINAKNYFCGYIWNKMYDLEIVKKHNIHFKDNLIMLEDLIFNAEYLSCPEVEKAYYISKPLYHYYIRKGSIINNINFKDSVTLKNKMTVFHCLEILLQVYEKNAKEFVYLIKERYIKTTYKYIYLYKKNHLKISPLDEMILQSKQYYYEIKNKLTIKSLIRLRINMLFPTLYAKLGILIRME